MATKNDGAHAGRKGRPAGPAQGAAPASSNPATIRKGVYLSALIYVEGDQAPAEDFNGLTTSTLKKILGDLFSTPHDGLTFALKVVNVKNNVEDEDLEEKFQF
jgi:hypothetical protein